LVRSAYNDALMLPVALVVAAYLIGSIPFSFLVVKLMAGKDVREHGSRNVGATNVARTAGRMAGVVALLLDIAKGWFAIVVARWIVSQPSWPFAPGPAAWQMREMWIAIAGVLAVLAHMFPLWLHFHGGKGVATAAGVILGLDPVVLLGAILVFAIVLLVFRYVSLASMVTAAAIPVLFRFLVAGPPFWRIVMSIAIAIAVIGKHHSNIARIIDGTERRMGQRKREEER
jgi:glycerol-3-phosphate acyltransferase PlsY